MKTKKRNNFIEAATEAKKLKICLVYDHWGEEFFTSYLNPNLWCKKTDAKIFRFELIKKFI